MHTHTHTYKHTLTCAYIFSTVYTHQDCTLFVQQSQRPFAVSVCVTLTCIHRDTHMCTHIHTHTRTFTRIHMCTHISGSHAICAAIAATICRIYVTHACIHRDAHMCTHTHTCALIHTHTHKHVHTCTYVHTYQDRTLFVQPSRWSLTYQRISLHGAVVSHVAPFCCNIFSSYTHTYIHIYI